MIESEGLVLLRDIPDSSFLSYQKMNHMVTSPRREDSDILLVHLRIFGFKMPVRFCFEDVICVFDEYIVGMENLMKLYEVQLGSHLIKQALEKRYLNIPEQHPYRHFCFVDDEETPMLEIVARSFTEAEVEGLDWDIPYVI